MKIYLASGFSVMNAKNRERELSRRFAIYRRLYSFYFIHDMKTIELFDLIKERNSK
jgi:hypothetical protein